MKVCVGQALLEHKKDTNDWTVWAVGSKNRGSSSLLASWRSVRWQSCPRTCLGSTVPFPFCELSWGAPGGP